MVLSTSFTEPGSNLSSLKLAKVEKVASAPSVLPEEARRQSMSRIKSLLLVLMDQLLQLNLWLNKLMTRAGSQTTTSTVLLQDVLRAVAQESRQRSFLSKYANNISCTYEWMRDEMECRRHGKPGNPVLDLSRSYLCIRLKDFFV